MQWINKHNKFPSSPSEDRITIFDTFLAGCWFALCLLLMGCDIYNDDLISDDNAPLTAPDVNEPVALDPDDDDDSGVIDSSEDSSSEDSFNPREFELAICKEAYDLKLKTIEERCQELPDCCYCKCELNEIVESDCDCSRFRLQNEIDYLKCDQTVYKSSEQCIADSDLCKSIIRSGTNSECG